MNQDDIDDLCAEEEELERELGLVTVDPNHGMAEVCWGDELDDKEMTP